MKKLIMTTVILFSLTASPALAQEQALKSIAIKVNGMICDFCAQSIEKVMGGKPGVTDVDVNLDSGLITLKTTSEASLSDEELKELVEDSGYSPVSITREEQ